MGEVLQAPFGEPANIQHFDLESANDQSWLDFWNDLMGQTFNGLVVDPAVDGFRSKLSRWALGDLAFALPSSLGCTVTRRVDTQPNPDGDRLVLHFVERGHGILKQRGREVELSPGDAVLCAAEEDYKFRFLTDHQISVIECPRSVLDLASEVVEGSIATKISVRHTSLRLLRDFVHSLWREAGKAQTLESLEPYSPIVMDMMGRLFCEVSNEGGPATIAGSERLIEAMNAFIDARLDDPDLCPSMLARELGVSLRSLQAICANHSTTPRARIAERRMEQAAEQLLQTPDARVADIAYACGFLDTAHFSRRFRSHHGLSPVQYRTG